MSTTAPGIRYAIVPILASLAPIALICLLANQFSDPVRLELCTKYSSHPVHVPIRLICRYGAD
jgi:hypothetical protein